MADVAALVKALRDRDDETRIIAEAAIWEIWGRSGDAEIDTLYQKGLQLMNFGAAGEAIQIFTIIIGKKPEFAEGWNKRATLDYSIGEYQKSLRDCPDATFVAVAGDEVVGELKLDSPPRNRTTAHHDNCPAVRTSPGAAEVSPGP